MKKWWMILWCIASIVNASAQERERLLTEFTVQYRQAEKVLVNAMTTVEMTAAAGNCQNISEQQLFRALEYKLRQTGDQAERLKIIAGFHRFSRDIQQLLATPRQMYGSSAGMRIYHAAAESMQRQIAILMLSADAEKRWQTVADAPLTIENKPVLLQNGRGSLTLPMFGQNSELEITVSPGNVFSFQQRTFVLIQRDTFLAMNDDYAAVYLAELQDGKLQIRNKSKLPYISKWELKANKLTLFYYEKSETIDLNK